MQTHDSPDHGNDNAHLQVNDSRIDFYPTRSSAKRDHLGRMAWKERSVPTVWADEDSRFSPPTGFDVSGHSKRGYTIQPGLLTPAEVQKYWSELNRLIARSSDTDDPRVIREPGSGDVRSIFDVHKTSADIAALAVDPRVLETARFLLGSEVYLHQSRINFMPGFAGSGFYWHSDFETWHAEDGLPSPRAVSLSIALTDNYAFNGGLMVIPGSHRYFIPGQGNTPDNNVETSLVRQEVGTPAQDDVTELTAELGIDQFTGAAGAGLWFDSNIMHGSGNNITPYPRSNIFLVFNSVANAPQEPFESTSRRPEHIAATEVDPLRR